MTPIGGFGARPLPTDGHYPTDWEQVLNHVSSLQIDYSQTPCPLLMDLLHFYPAKRGAQRPPRAAHEAAA